MRYYLQFGYLILILLLFSCERIDIQDNKRLVFSGNLTDESGQPISNALISSTLLNSDNISNIQNITGQSQSDDNGNFEFIALVPKATESNLIIDSNFSNDEQNEDSRYVNFNLYFPSSRVFDEVFEVNITDLVLPRQSKLEIDIKKTSSDSVILNWSVDYISDVCFVEISSVEELDNISFCNNYIRFSEQNNPNNPDTKIDLHSLRNSEAIFSYNIDGEPTQTIQIPLNNADDVFEFTY